MVNAEPGGRPSARWSAPYPETVASTVVARFAVDYARRPGSQALARYEHAKAGAWNATTDLPWDTDVDQEAMARRDAAGRAGLATADLSGTPFERWSEREWLTLAIETQNWTLSQLLHGEHAGMLICGRLVQTVPDLEDKYLAAVQLSDETRHTEAFARYLTTKMSGCYPVNPQLDALLRDLLTDSRWDISYLGMQVMVEGLALAVFAFLYQQVISEPLLATMIRYVRADEARHVSYGIAALAEIYPQLTSAELAERQEFTLEAAVRLRERLLRQEVWDRLELPVGQACAVLRRSPGQLAFERTLFGKIFGNCDKIGLLDHRGGWLRSRLSELGFWVAPSAAP